MAFECIRSETTENGVLVLTLNDPATRNALGGQLSDELEGEVDRFGQDPALRVLVITGADPAFCSGANVRGSIVRSKSVRRKAPRLPWSLGAPGSRLHGR